MSNITEIKISATRHEDRLSHFNLTIVFDSVDTEAAEAVVKLFPKYAKVSASEMVFCDGRPRVSIATVRVHFWSTGVTGEKNETGAKRVRAMLKTLDKNDMPVTFETIYKNHVADRAELESLI